MSGNADTEKPRSSAAFLLWVVLGALACAGFVELGNWQLRRLTWKLELIARVDQRLQAPPEAAPARAQWPSLGATDEYRKLCLDGSFRHDRETLVRAVTRLGPGYWVLTPLHAADGSTVLVNRGFVGTEQKEPASRAAGQVEGSHRVCGLLRSSEHGAFLRRNVPAEGRWYSRDVAAIAAARDLPAPDVAPYFLDADAALNPGGWPLGGLTVVQFRNSHLSYAVTWYALALLTAGGVVLLVRYQRRGRADGVK